MSFFQNIKDMHALKQQAELMQAQLKDQRVEGFSKDKKFKVVINGNHEILEIDMPDEGLTKAMVQVGVIEAFTDARNKLEQIMREQMMSQMMG